MRCGEAGVFSDFVSCRLVRCTQDLGVKVDETLFTDLNYADDAVLFSDDPSTWPNSLQRFESEANNMGMYISWVKTKVQNIGCGPQPASVTVVGQPVDSVEKFTYLG